MHPPGISSFRLITCSYHTLILLFLFLRSAAVAGTDTVDSGPGKVSLCLRLLVKLLFLALLIAAALYFYQVMFGGH